jgi:ABC-2 type transport system ATP-binding protein
MSSEPIIRIDGVTVRYGRKTAVDGVTLTVPRGAVYALLGRNGAGKSSLVRCLLGQQKPAAGAIALFGDDVWRRRAALMERVGVVSEDADAPPDMTVAALARFCARLYARWNQSLVDARLRRFDIAPGARFGDLSKGQKKQVGLALATATSPDLLILDDPTLGLDVVARKALFEEVIGELADRGITVFVTTHDLGGIEALADRVGILKDGALVVDDELEALKSRFRRIRYPAAIARAVVSNYSDAAVEQFSGADVAPMSLEEIFIAVAGEGAES